MAMDIKAFEESLQGRAPPAGLGLALEALWFAAKGDWNVAHERAQAQQNKDGSWVHAHLHRQEGDESNAAYWYRKAGRPFAQQSLEEEWKTLVQALLASRPE
jgi:hypothetical protein